MSDTFGEQGGHQKLDLVKLNSEEHTAPATQSQTPHLKNTIETKNIEITNLINEYKTILSRLSLERTTYVRIRTTTSLPALGKPTVDFAVSQEDLSGLVQVLEREVRAYAVHREFVMQQRSILKAYDELVEAQGRIQELLGQGESTEDCDLHLLGMLSRREIHEEKRSVWLSALKDHFLR